MSKHTRTLVRSTFRRIIRSWRVTLRVCRLQRVCPSSKTRILSQRRATPSRCEMTSVARDASLVRSSRIISTSATGSIAAVGSSNTTNWLCRKSPRATARRSHSPPDTSRPPNSCPSHVSRSRAKVEPALSKGVPHAGVVLHAIQVSKADIIPNRQ